MLCRLEYHQFVNRPPIPAWFPLCGILLLPLLLSVSSAQINNSAGSPRSVGVAPPTAIRVAPPTATTAAPPTAGFAHVPRNPLAPRSPHGINNGNHPRRNANGTAFYPYVYGVPVPYAVDVSDAQAANDQDDQDAQNGDAQNGDPTSMDRPGSHRPPSANRNRGQIDDDPPTDASAEPPQPPTTLVFKDGHQLAVNNYAIVDQTLYDLTPGHPRKIALAELDLPATEKQNDDHGVVFQLPPTAQAN